MELVRCPACGCRVQMAEPMLGRRVRCISCAHAFVADPGADPAPSWAASPPAEPAPAPAPAPARARSSDEEFDTGRARRGPFCPGCGRSISWDVPACPHCGEELEPEAGPRRRPFPYRLDGEPHRGPTVAALGNISLITGGLSLCVMGLGALVAVPLGVLAWVMASRDLELMRTGAMDPEGRAQTENGRTCGVIGLVLGLLFAGFYVLLYLHGSFW